MGDPIGNAIDILIVDDREDGLLALEAVLEKPGLNIVKAQSGQEALDLLAKFDFATILLDVQMPGLDGFETAALIRKSLQYQHTPLIFVTAINKDDAYVYRGYELGAVDYIFKPFDPYILRSKVDFFIEAYRKTRQLEYQAEVIRQSERRERYLRLAELEVESLRRYRSLADAIPHIIWKTSGEGMIDYVNAVWTLYTGVQFEQSLGTGWQSAFHPDDLRILLKRWLDSMTTEEPFEVEVRIRRYDGVYRWHLLRAVPEKRNLQVHAWIGTSTDIHDRKTMEEQLNAARIQAESASRAKTHFLANMSHEIRTPLNAILGFAELMLAPGQTKDDHDRHVSTIRRSGRQLLGIIDEILDISKIEAGHLQVERIEVDLPAVVADVKAMMALTAREKSLRFEFKFKNKIPKMIFSDPTRVRQILMNLVGNAVKFTSKGHIQVELDWIPTGEHTGKVRFAISDTGPGISTDDAQRLFRPFVQVDTSTTRRFGGTGLGLALSRKLAQLMGGDVKLETSVPGAGSTFVAELAADVIESKGFVNQLVEEDDRTIRAREDMTGRLAGMKVLVVDDSTDNQTLISRFLISAGASVDLAGNGLEGVRKATETDYEVVLMDIQMPELDGYAATARLRTQGYDKPIVALTAHALKEERDRCLNAGCTSHLTKPVDKRLLIEHVASLAGREIH